MQGSLFTESSMVKTPPPAKKQRKARKKKPGKVVRGKIKRHPVRPPAKKRVVKTKKVAMQNHEDGPHGEIVERDGDILFVKWPGRSKISMHNARFMVPVEDK